MDIFIKWSNDTKYVRLPILPESVTIGGAQNNQSVMIHDLGEINLKGKRGLYSVTLSSIFPHERLDFQHGSFQDPYDYYVAYLKKLYEANTTVHLIITGTDISMFCTIESFDYGEEDRSGDVRYTLSLKEYREIKADGSEVRPTKAIENVAHIWKKGDTWELLTKNERGSSVGWKDVRKSNESVIKEAIKKTGKKEREALIGYKVVIRL